MKKILLLLVLSGCANSLNGYEPQLSSPAKDLNKYQSDKTECASAANEKLWKARSPKSAFLGGFGLIGGIADGVTTTDAEYNEADPRTQLDECMRLKGYAVIKQNHCC